MQVKKDDIKEKILNSARREFLKHGYDGASLRVIAEKEELTKGAIYSYFKNKDSLFCELAAEAINYITASFEEDDFYDNLLDDSFTPLEQTIQYFRSCTQAVLDNYSSFKLLLFCAAGSSLQNYKEEIVEIYTKNFYKLCSLINHSELLYEGFFSAMTIHSLASVYVSLLEEIVLNGPNRKEVNVYVEQLATFMNAGYKSLFLHQQVKLDTLDDTNDSQYKKGEIS